MSTCYKCGTELPEGQTGECEYGCIAGRDVAATELVAELKSGEAAAIALVQHLMVGIGAAAMAIKVNVQGADYLIKVKRIL